MVLRCLIVDDSAEFIASATRLLERQALQIVGHAASSSEALRLATLLEPDVALVDVRLGEESGVELSELLARSVPGLRVVLISAEEQDELVELIGATHAAGFIGKSALSAEAIRCLLA